MSIAKQLTLIFLVSIFFPFPAYATDDAREQRWAKQVSEFLDYGDTHWLKADGREFLGIYTPTTNPSAFIKTKGAVILLHNRGLHPDWPQVVQPLRTQLPSKGWATLSLQMPVLANYASDEDYVPLFKLVPSRIQAGLDFLSKHNINNVVLIGHGLGSNMGSYFLAKNSGSRIKGFVGIGMKGKPQTTEYLPLDNVYSLLRMYVPVLSVYGSKSYLDEFKSMDRLAFALTVYQSNVRSHHSQQIKIKGANNFFQGHEDELTQAITKWMTKITTPKQINLTSKSNLK